MPLTQWRSIITMPLLFLLRNSIFSSSIVVHAREIYMGVEDFSSSSVYVATRPMRAINNNTNSNETTIISFDRTSLLTTEQVTVPIGLVAGIYYHSPNLHIVTKNGLVSMNWATKIYQVVVKAPVEISIFVGRSSIDRATEKIYILGIYKKETLAKAYALITYQYGKDKKAVSVDMINGNDLTGSLKALLPTASIHTNRLTGMFIDGGGEQKQNGTSCAVASSWSMLSHYTGLSLKQEGQKSSINFNNGYHYPLALNFAMSILVKKSHRSSTSNFQYVFSPSGATLLGKIRILRVDDTYNTHHGNASTHIHIFSLCSGTQVRIELNHVVHTDVIGSYTETTLTSNVTLLKTSVSLSSGYNKVYVTLPKWIGRGRHLLNVSSTDGSNVYSTHNVTAVACPAGYYVDVEGESHPDRSPTNDTCTSTKYYFLFLILLSRSM
jgi:hypothetical protein